MDYRTHGDWAISEIGVGCYALSGAYGIKDVGEFRRMLNRAHELGVNLFDTAEAYGNAEQILGEVVKPYRTDVRIATKVGIRQGTKPNLSPEYIEHACVESLRRLQTDYIDLYQVHFDDPKVPIQDTVSTLERLVETGKILRYGVSHLPRVRIEEYCENGHLFSILMELSAVARHSRGELLPLCTAHDVSAIAFSPTGRGLLTDASGNRETFAPGDMRNIDPLFQRERFDSGLRVAERIRVLGNHYGKTTAQAAIAWVLSQPSVICALTGPSTIEHLEENLGASGWSYESTDLADLKLFLQHEDELLKQEQRTSIEGILSGPLPEEPSQAYVDLIYTIETAVLLNLISENEILPIFHELYAMRKTVSDNETEQLEVIRKKLHSLVVTEHGSQ